MNKIKITLPVPVKTGAGETVKEVSLAAPTAGQMRGLKLADVLQLDVRAMITLIPRIASPALSEDDVAQMNPAAFTALATETLGFFASPEELAALRKG